MCFSKIVSSRWDQNFMSEKYIVTWDILQMHARTLAQRLLPAKQWKGIIAVSRGGLVSSAIVACDAISIRSVFQVTTIIAGGNLRLLSEWKVMVKVILWSTIWSILAGQRKLSGICIPKAIFCDYFC